MSLCRVYVMSVVCGLMLGMCGSPLMAQPLAGRDVLLGDWGGQRSSLEEKGLHFEFVYTADFLANLSGGLDEGFEYLDNMDLTLTIDADRLWGWDDTRIFLYGLGNHGGNPSADRVGDVQAITNIEAPDTWKLYEAWVEKGFLDEKLSMLIGLHDMNSEFDVIETAQLFLNSSHGMGPDFSQGGLNGPSIFPTTSLGVRLRYHRNDAWYWQSAVYDAGAGDPAQPKGTQILLGKGEGALIVSEAGWMREVETQPYAKVALGGWFYTAKFDHALSLDGQGALKKDHNVGIYGLAEYQIYQEQDDPAQGLAIFLRIGYAEEDINPLDLYTGGGLVYTGLLPHRPEDQCGLAVAVAHNGDAFQKANAPIEDEEIAIEATYRYQATPWLAIQPDIQYIINPGTVMNVDDAVIFGARLEVVL